MAARLTSGPHQVPAAVGRPSRPSQLLCTVPAMTTAPPPRSVNEGVETYGLDHSLLRGIDWRELEQRVRAQQRNREVYTPPISLFRWWARRSHALIGALLDASVDARDGASLCVSDPYSGGGTVAIEAARRGLPVYAQDLHPWAVTGVATALDRIDHDAFAEAARALLEMLAPLRRQLYALPCEKHGEDSEVLTTLWVRKTVCPRCAASVFLFPYSMITRASRAVDEPYAWWGCRACGHVTCSHAQTQNRCCGGCGRSLPAADTALLPDRMAQCPNRRCAHEFAAFAGTPEYEPALVQRQCRSGQRTVVHFDRPNGADLASAHVDVPSLPGALTESIPAGLESQVLRRAGLRRWCDLYPRRQLAVMLAASRAVAEMELPAAQRNRLRLAIVGACEMAGYVSRWDRFYPKAFEALANHRFALVGLSAETNLLADRGRGTLPRRLKASGRAAEWVNRELPEGAAPTWLPPRHRRIRLTHGITVSAGSSERQRLGDGTVDLVLTDPPYFDDVQYGELAALFLTWSRALGLLPSSVEVDLRSEAVVNRVRGTDLAGYRKLLTTIFRECRRTLKDDGRILLTFHNKDVRAWWALARALRSADLHVQTLAVSASENDADHSKRGRLGFTKDLVIECGIGAQTLQPTTASSDNESQALELIAAGRCLALGGTDSLDAFRERFQALRGGIRPQRISSVPEVRRASARA
jgi:putative DNA methylase